MAGWHRWTAEEDALLGTVSDAEAAKIIGVTPHQALRRRHNLGIPTCPTPRKRPSPWTADRLARLGSAPDADLAREWGLSRGAVHRKRADLGIPAFDPVARGRDALAAAVRAAGGPAAYARQAGVSRQAIHQRLRVAGIDPASLRGD